jgi:4-amino-4-deoxy-L-arabinose transferase-like glycosyltransferase
VTLQLSPAETTHEPSITIHTPHPAVARAHDVAAIPWSDVLGLTLLATVLRVWGSSWLGIDHYDEGAYALTAASLASGTWPQTAYPIQHFLSPALYVGLAAGVMRVIGTTAVGLLSVSVAAGVGTVALVYVATHRWFGRGAAGAAALAVGLSDYHILYSRAGLTDALFTGLLVLAVVLFAIADERESASMAAMAGVVTGLAWNTKYHGWLALVIAAGAGLPRLWWSEDRARAWRPILGRLILSSALALLLYMPWILYVASQPGGYASLAAEHARFLQPARAVENGLAYIAAQRYLDGWTARILPLVLVLWIVLSNRAARRLEATWWLVPLVITSLALGATVTLALVAAAAAIVVLLRHGRTWTSQLYPIACFVLFTIVIPLYRPYPRLLLPWIVASAILGGVGVEMAMVARLTTKLKATLVAVAAAMAVLLANRGIAVAANPWRARDGFQTATARLDRVIRGPLPVIVIGEPAVVFYVRSSGREAWHANEPQDALLHVPAGSPYYLVAGIYARRVRGPESFTTWLDHHPDAILAGTVRVEGLSDVRLLDDFGPNQAGTFRAEQRDDYRLEVYRVER